MNAEKKYRKAVRALIKDFEKKHELEFEDFMGYGLEVACFGDYYFNLADIYFDLDSKQPKGLILEWYYESLDHPDKIINYHHYAMGLRFINTKTKN